MWSESEAPAVEDLFAILRLRDKDWLLETLRKRYDLLQSAYDAPSKGRARNLKHKRDSTDESSIENAFSSCHEDIGPFDLTAATIRTGHVVSDHIAALRAVDWSATDLGPMSTWSAQLRRNVNFLLVDPRAAALYWGPTKIMIYNESYSSVLAEKHPWAMGKRFNDVWPEVAGTELTDAFAKADATGQASRGDRAPFFVKRRGFLEEMFGNWSIVPIIGSGGNLRTVMGSASWCLVLTVGAITV